MRVCDLKRYVEAWRDSAVAPLDVALGRAWHFNHSYREGEVDFGNLPGVYIYTEPSSPDWSVPIEANSRAIWYIGKSDSSLARRVWAHMGWIYDPLTGGKIVNEPRFKHHRWADDPDVRADIKDALSHGEVVAYTIKVEPVGAPPGYPLALEKYLLASFYRATGALPPLNRDL